MTPKISVIVTHYNQSQFLSHALQSVYSQTIAVEECIAVDDCSDSRDWVEVVKQFPQSKVLINPIHQGIAAALNHGIRWMQGDVFVWLPADDILFPYALEKKLELYNQGETESVIYSGCVLVNQEQRSMLDEPARVVSPEQFYEESLRQCFIRCTGIWIPQILFGRHGYFPRTFTDGTPLPCSEDYFWTLRAARDGARFIGIQEPLFYKRLHPNQQSVLYQQQIPEIVARIKKEIICQG